MTRVRIQRPGIAFLLSQLGGQSSKRWTERIAPLGLEPREVMLFRFVALADGRSQREVAQAIGLPPSRIVGLVDRLEERGWVERRRSGDDRRTHALHVTASGQVLLVRLATLSKEHENELTTGLGPADRATLAELLGRIAATQGLATGVHPGFADARAHPGHDDELDQTSSDPKPGRPRPGPTAKIEEAR